MTVLPIYRSENVKASVPATPAVAPVGAVRNVLVAVTGNALEWFDVVVYGFFAAIVAKLFFPSNDPSISLILALGTFGASFLVRPLGALVIGRYADRNGRKAALILVSMLMMLGTAIIAFLPTYAQIGVAAPIFLLAARLIQGFSAGGEFGSATAFLAEQMPTRRAFFASWQFASQGIATLLASGFGLILTSFLSTESLSQWGWRLPFFFGMLIGPVAYLIRSQAHETPEFMAMKDAVNTDRLAPDAFAFRVLVGCGAVAVATVAMYLMLYVPTMATADLGLPTWAGFTATFVAGAVLLIVPPLSGLTADRRGRLRVAVPAILFLLIAPIPIFHWLVAAPSPTRLIIMQVLLSLATSAYFGALPAMLSEMFPISQRTTGLSLCYNLAVVFVGGFAPLIFAAMVKWTGSAAAPALYLVAAAAASLMAVIVAGRKQWTW